MAFFYRIVKSKRASNVLDGEGSRIAGGRWNPPGLALAYLSESRALAALEIFVHWGRQATRIKWVVASVEIPDKLILIPRITELPGGWDALPSSPTSRKYGTEWASSFGSLAMALPSAIIPDEKNLLINVGHPQFSEIGIARIEPFQFDSRLGQ